MIEKLHRDFEPLSVQERIAFLADLAHHITVVERGLLTDELTENSIRGLKGLNELQNVLSQNISHLADGTNEYAPSLLLRILCEKASTYGLSAYFNECLLKVAARRLEGVPRD